jgi:peroxiredoxin Q/BCP
MHGFAKVQRAQAIGPGSKFYNFVMHKTLAASNKLWLLVGLGMKLMIALTAFALFGLGGASADPLKEGEAAPEFALKGSDGKTHKLSDYKGKKAVVLAWYPKAFTPGCTTECKSMRAHSADLKKLDAVYFAVSCDTPEQNKKFAESLDADYPILSDPTCETAKAYGVLPPEKKTASRVTFYIGKDGKILYMDNKVKTASHGADIAAKLKELGVAEKKS